MSDYSTSSGPIFYQNWLAHISRQELRLTYEAPLFTDAHVTGTIESESDAPLGPYKLINVVSLDAPLVARPAIILRADSYLDYAQTSPMRETNDENYHGGGLIDEIAALMSLHCGIRLQGGEVNREFRVGSDSKGVPSYLGEIFKRSPQLPGKLPRQTSFVLPSAIGTHALRGDLEKFRRIPLFDPSSAVALVRSARLYQQAVWIAETDPEYGWLLFVSAVEVAANHWRQSNRSNLERLKASKPQLLALLEEKGDEDFTRKIADEVVPYMGATNKFISFLLKFLPDVPPERPSKYFQLNWSKTALRKTLNKVYEYRSRALHGGTPFPAPMCDTARCFDNSSVVSEIPFGGNIEGGVVGMKGSSWRNKDVPMLLHTFEYIVRNALNKWWQALGSEQTT